jgi:hypothetical protein
MGHLKEMALESTNYFSQSVVETLSNQRSKFAMNPLQSEQKKLKGSG